MAGRTALPKRLEKEVYQQFGSRCPFCDERDVATLQIHHIEPHAIVQEHKADNLLLTCANCHQKIEDGRISLRDVLYAKLRAGQDVFPARQPEKPTSEYSVVMSGDNHGVVANKVSIVTSKTSVTMAPPSGTIAADYKKRNYAKYLIDRYHEFKQADVGKGNVKYPILYASIKREFRANWDSLGSDNFEMLVRFLQAKIDGTILGRNLKARGQKTYSTFQEHTQK